MATLSKRAQILFSPDEYFRLKEEAEISKSTVCELVRKAVSQVYFQKRDSRKLEAAKRLISMRLPVDDWEKMEAEIEEGAL